MPWQLEAMKDVVGYEKPRGAVKQALIRGCPNGETQLFLTVIKYWIHRYLKQTQGTEISKYLEEKKSTEIPLVATSERGTAQIQSS